MRLICARTAVNGIVLTLLLAASSAAQTMEKVDFFPDSIAEKDDHVVRLSGGSSWLLANRTTALAAADVLVVMRDVVVDGKRVPTAFLYVGGEEIPAKHVEGVYPKNVAYLTRVVAAEAGTTLRLADGTELSVPRLDRYAASRWTPPYKALLTEGRIYLYNLKENRRVLVQPAKSQSTKPK